MTTELLDRSSRYFEENIGLSLDKLLAPINADKPAGYPLKGSDTYNKIQNARRQDDATLPMGIWERELKPADWPTVSLTAVEALSNKTKDLQLAAWLLEAQIHEHGFAAVAPCLLLIDGLLQTYWNDLYPQDADSRWQYRANILSWLDKQTVPALRQINLTATGGQHDYRLSDWELAWRQEQQAAATPGASPEAHADNLNTIAEAMALTPTAWYQLLGEQLADALVVLHQLSDRINSYFPEDRPNLSALAGLLEQIYNMVDSELRRRGMGLVLAA